MMTKKEIVYKLDSTPDAQRCKSQHGYSVEVYSSLEPDQSKTAMQVNPNKFHPSTRCALIMKLGVKQKVRNGPMSYIALLA